MLTEEWLERDKTALAGVLPRASDIVASYGEGSWIVDVDGNRYLDFGSGIAVNNTGHCHPQVVQAIKDQAENLIHVSVTTHQTVNIELAERLGGLCPFFEEPQVFFSNSGAEAVDGSLKLARRVTARSGVIAFQGAFHGRTVAATSLTTAKRKYRDGYTPHLPYVYHAPYWEDGGAAASLERVETLLKNNDAVTLPAYKIGAVIVEPVLGEGGYIVPSEAWLHVLRSLCTKYGALLIFDEVQTGIGRTGQWFAAETFGVTPDILLAAKALGSGLPIGAIVAECSLMNQWPEGTHGSTFGGNPVSCAAALATLDIIEPLLPRVREKGEEILDKLGGWSESLGIRGVGYMIGIELSSSVVAKRVQAQCLSRGLIVLLCGPEDRVIRLIPPLTISDADLELGLEILDWALISGILMYSS